MMAPLERCSERVDAASSAGDQLSRNFRQSKEGLFAAIESHPFMVGGIGCLLAR
jgi:hypothetical protein